MLLISVSLNQTPLVSFSLEKIFHKFFFQDDDEMKETREQYEANNLTIPTERMLRGFLPASPSGISTARLRRKLKIKILKQKLEGNVNFVWTTGGHRYSTKLHPVVVSCSFIRGSLTLSHFCQQLGHISNISFWQSF